MGYNFHLADDARDIDRLLRTDAWTYLEGVRIESYLYGEELRPYKHLPENVLADVAGILDAETAQDLQRKWENLFVTNEGELTIEEEKCIEFLIELRNVPLTKKRPSPFMLT